MEAINQSRVRAFSAFALFCLATALNGCACVQSSNSSKISGTPSFIDTNTAHAVFIGKVVEYAFVRSLWDCSGDKICIGNIPADYILAVEPTDIISGDPDTGRLPRTVVIEDGQRPSDPRLFIA